MMMSVAALNTLQMMKAKVRSKHFPLTAGLYTALRGMHCNAIQSKRAMLYVRMKEPRARTVVLNLLTGKRRPYRQRTENLKVRRHGI